jgi:heme/copper-type cytochrome/quinol oxidase subunit 2
MKTKILALGMLFLTGIPNIVAACSVCFADGDDAVSQAFNWSIAFLMAAPYLVVGSIGGCLFYFYRRAASSRARAEESDQPVVHLAWNQEENGR